VAHTHALCRIGNESVPIQLAQCRFPRLAISDAKYKYIFQIKYTEAILSNSTRKLLWFEISKMLTAVLKIKFIVLFIIIFGTFSFPIPSIVYASLCYVSLLRLVCSTRTELI